MGLVEVEVGLVFLADFRDRLEVADLALHGVDALDHDEDLAPRPPSARHTEAADTSHEKAREKS